MRAICTSAPLQASIRVSPDFTLFRHSSPPFGSKQAHSNSPSWWRRSVLGMFYVCTPTLNASLSVREKYWQQYLPSCVSVWLLGPCFKTGEGTPFSERQLVFESTGKKRFTGKPELAPLPQLLSPVPFSTLVCPTKSSRRMECWIMLQGWAWQKWRYFHCHCHDFRFYVTLFPKCFSNFRSHYLFAIGLPILYLTLADTYLPIDTAIPNSATLL